MTPRFALLTEQDIETIVEDKDHFLFVECIIKQLLDAVFDIQNNQGLGKGYQPQVPSASADNPHLDLDYSGYHKNLIQ